MLGALGREAAPCTTQHILNIVLLIAVAGASIPLLISLVQQVLKGNFSVDILALLSVVTSLILAALGGSNSGSDAVGWSSAGGLRYGAGFLCAECFGEA